MQRPTKRTRNTKEHRTGTTGSAAKRSLLTPLGLGTALLLLAGDFACLHIPDSGADQAGAPDAPKTAAEVLERHIAGIGGAEKVRAIGQRTVEARVIFKGPTECPEGDEECDKEDQTGSFLLQNTADGRLYRRMVVGDFIEERGFDGKVGWSLGNNGALRVDTEKEAAVSREDAVLHWYFDLDKRGVELSLLPPRRQDSGGQPVVLDGVTWKMPDESTKELWFDRRTGRLVEERVKDGEGDDAQSQVIVYEDYKPVDGVLVPHKIVVTTKTGPQPPVVTEFVTQRVDHAALEGQKFAVPTLPAPTAKPDLWLARLEEAKAASAANPKDSGVLIDEARAAFAAGRFEEALDAAKRTLAVERNEPEALLTLGRVQVLQGDLKGAQRTLDAAAKAGVRPEVIARQTAWIAHRKRDFDKLADVLDEAGSAVMAGRYRSFAGEPLRSTIEGNACTVQVPMMHAQPLAIVEVDIGGEKVGAIIDTGASDLIMSRSLAEKLKVPLHARAPQAQEGAMELGFGELPQLDIGSLSLENVPMTMFADEAVASMAGEHADKVQAVIGTGLLSDFIIGIDVPGETFKLVSQASRCRRDQQAMRQGASVPFAWHETHYMYVRGKMNDAEGVFLLNTGMRGADMTATQRAYGHAAIAAPPMRSDRAPMVTVDTLELGDVQREKLRSAFGFFETTQTSDGFRLDGMLGMGVLGQKPFVIDFAAQRIYFPEG